MNVPRRFPLFNDVNVESGWGKAGARKGRRPSRRFSEEGRDGARPAPGSIVVQSKASPRAGNRSSPSVVTTPGLSSPSMRRVNVSRSGSVLVEKYQDSPGVTHGQVQGQGTEFRVGSRAR